MPVTELVVTVGRLAVNVAVTLLAAFIVTLQVDPTTLEQLPDQEVKDAPEGEEAERITDVPEL